MSETRLAEYHKGTWRRWQLPWAGVVADVGGVPGKVLYVRVTRDVERCYWATRYGSVVPVCGGSYSGLLRYRFGGKP